MSSNKRNLPLCTKSSKTKRIADTISELTALKFGTREQQDLNQELLKINEEIIVQANKRNDVTEAINNVKSKLDSLQNELSGLNIICEHQNNVIKKLRDGHESVLQKKKERDLIFNYYGFCKNALSTDPGESKLWFMSHEECPVCLEKSVKLAKLNHCQHLVCESCLSKLLKQTDNCPLCRQVIASHEIFDLRTMRTKYIINSRLARRQMVVEIGDSDGDDISMQYVGHEGNHSEDGQYMGLPGRRG